VPKRLHLIVVLVAWFLSTGAQWDLVQTFGWGRMIAEYNRTMPLTEAVKKAFDGELCGVCEAVDGAKQQEADAAPALGKLELKYVMTVSPATFFLGGVSLDADWPRGDRFGLSLDRPAPPLPPPRA
jgi:hypothetical protein